MTNPEGITWLAHYDDGDQLAQANGTTYADIDRDRLQAFDLWRAGRLLVRVDMRNDGGPDHGPKRLIWRVRNQVDTGGHSLRLHLAGWQRTVNGRNVQAICYVFEDGAVLLGGQFDESVPFMSAVQPMACEADLR